MKKYYSVNEVAAKLDLHPRTIRRRISQGDLQATKIGKQYRISIEQVNELLGSEKFDSKNIVSVSSVIEITNISEQKVIEIQSKMTSIFLTGVFQGALNYSFNRDLNKLKIFLDCTTDMAPEIFSILKLYINSALIETSNGKGV